MTTATASRAQLAELARTIGARMKSARRDLHNMSLKVAAVRLGYANSSKLSKIENSTDTVSVPLLTIVKAARLYEVPVDYLFGLTDDWDWQPTDGVSSGAHHLLHQMMESSLKRQMEVLRQLEGRQQAFLVACDAMSEAAVALDVAYKRMVELNPEFESDIRGGGTLKSRIDRVCGAAKLADAAKHRFHVECQLARMPDSAQTEMDV